MLGLKIFEFSDFILLIPIKINNDLQSQKQALFLLVQVGIDLPNDTPLRRNNWFGRFLLNNLQVKASNLYSIPVPLSSNLP